jgi:hypothetical protein
MLCDTRRTHKPSMSRCPRSVNVILGLTLSVDESSTLRLTLSTREYCLIADSRFMVCIVALLQTVIYTEWLSLYLSSTRGSPKQYPNQSGEPCTATTWYGCNTAKEPQEFIPRASLEASKVSDRLSDIEEVFKQPAFQATLSLKSSHVRLPKACGSRASGRSSHTPSFFFDTITRHHWSNIHGVIFPYDGVVAGWLPTSKPATHILHHGPTGEYLTHCSGLTMQRLEHSPRTFSL